MKSYSYRILTILLGLFTLGCSLMTGFGEQLGSTRTTAQAAITQIGGGVGIIETAQALATKANSEVLFQTAQVAITQASQSGLVETVQSIATDQGPALLATAQAMATDQGQGLETTAQAIATRLANQGKKPDDIPVPEVELNNYIATPTFVSFITALAFTDVVAFYKTQMPAKGWSASQNKWLENDNSAYYVYEKSDNRKAIITVTLNLQDNSTIVLIVIT